MRTGVYADKQGAHMSIGAINYTECYLHEVSPNMSCTSHAHLPIGAKVRNHSWLHLIVALPSCMHSNSPAEQYPPSRAWLEGSLYPHSMVW